MKKYKAITIQWAPKVVDIGIVHVKEPKMYQHKKTKKIKRGRGFHKHWVAYDLTSYHVGTGESPMRALQQLGWQLWAGEFMTAEEEAKGIKVHRERLHLRCKEAIPEMLAEMRKFPSKRINGVEWRTFFPFPFGEKAARLMKLSS